jgi:hypothetical protein
MKPTTKKRRRITARLRAEGFGHMAAMGMKFGKWYGPQGLSHPLIAQPVESVAACARLAAHHAIAHRERYPKKGQA